MKKRIIDQIIKVEGGYVNDPADSGGETNYGITVRRARSYGYTGAMIDLPRQKAFDIYSDKYWDAVCADQIIELSELICEEVVDTSVNMGPRRASKYLQRALNVLNNRTKLYPDLVADGRIGRKSISALKMYLKYRDESALHKALNCLQGAFYITLAERREKDERFVYGWYKNRIS